VGAGGEEEDEENHGKGMIEKPLKV